MAYLTASTGAAAVRQRTFATNRLRRKHLSRFWLAGRVSRHAVPIFRDRGANFVEMQCLVFHYSVIIGYAAILCAPWFVGCHLLNRKALASNPEAAAAGADAQAGYDDDLTQFAPASIQTGGRKIQANDSGFAD